MWKTYTGAVLLIAAMSLLLSLVTVTNIQLSAGETIGQWIWFDKTSVWAFVCILLSFLFLKKGSYLTVDIAVSWALIILCAVEAVWGLRQLYGFTASNHSLYALTGSFFNPGPYSGYLAMGLPVCLHRWLIDKEQGKGWLPLRDGKGLQEKVVGGIKYILSGGTILLILCVLPATMSRSAWLAAGISCLWVYACHAGWGDKIRERWRLQRKRMITILIGASCVLLLAGYLLFALKPDSARGRLFMWKITCHAIAGKLSGYGIDQFAAAYGNAQEAYFAAGDYEPWEERVAGSPEYAFNEYLQLTVEWGLPLALCLLAVVLLCLYIGIRKKRYGICGAVLSLMIFSFSSYPLQLPAFIVTAVVLLLACVLGNSRWEWLGLAVIAGIIGGARFKKDRDTGQACREWMNAKMLYTAGAYEAAEKDYERLYPLLKNRAAFLFEYGHGLHKQQKFRASNRILIEAMQRSCDPMILNIIGKNCQQAGDCLAAEGWFIRSTHRLPGRIYPYYLLAKLYAEPGFSQPDKFEKMKRMVLTKEPKVNSTAIRQMRDEVKKMSVNTDFQ